jgi:hypothetical protein
MSRRRDEVPAVAFLVKSAEASHVVDVACGETPAPEDQGEG